MKIIVFSVFLRPSTPSRVLANSSIPPKMRNMGRSSFKKKKQFIEFYLENTKIKIVALKVVTNLGLTALQLETWKTALQNILFAVNHLVFIFFPTFKQFHLQFIQIHPSLSVGHPRHTDGKPKKISFNQTIKLQDSFFCNSVSVALSVLLQTA